jgi:hypothetical protein
MEIQLYLNRYCKRETYWLASSSVSFQANRHIAYQSAIHVHTAGGDPSPLHLLPSAPLRLVKRKIIKALSLPSPPPATFTCWTVQNADDLKNGEDVTTGVEMDDDGKEIGWWLQDGDYVHVDL